MAGRGKVPKDAASRHGRGGKPQSKVEAPATGVAEIPKWPLAPDVSLRAQITVLEEVIESVEDEICGETDGRKLAGLRRQLRTSTSRLAVLKQTLIEASQLELEIWRGLWRLPHAEQWRKAGYLREVALYARHQARAECGSMDDSKEARQRSDRLGLSPRSSATLGWKFQDAPLPPEVSATGSDGEATVTSISSRRARLSEG